jgi:hypothetical protein
MLGWEDRIKQDDRTIQNEGLDTLSEPELQAAFRDWGMLGLRSVEEMQKVTLLPVHILLILSFIFGVCFSQLQIVDFVTYHNTFWMAMFLILFIELIAV